MPSRFDKTWLKEKLAASGNKVGLVVALMLISSILICLRTGFENPANLTNVLRQISINGILAIGVTLVLLTGGVDLSLGSLVALTGVSAAMFAHPGEWPLFVPILIGIFVGATAGGINGIIVTRGRVPSFIVTLGMMTAARGLALVLSKGRPVSNMSREMVAIAGNFMGIPIPTIILIAVALATWWFLANTKLGRHIYAVGGNEKAARAAGIDVVHVKQVAYLACGAACGLAGVILAARITTGQPNAGIAYELDAIAAAVIGGTSLSGGVGSVNGTILGALLMGVISNGLDLLNVSSYYQQIIKGVIIVAAVMLDPSKKKKEE